MTTSRTCAPSVPYLPLFLARHACARRSVVPSLLPSSPAPPCPALLRRKTPARLGLGLIGRCPSPATNAQLSSPPLPRLFLLPPLPNRKRFLALRGDRYPHPEPKSQPYPIPTQSTRIRVASPSSPLLINRNRTAIKSAPINPPLPLLPQETARSKIDTPPTHRTNRQPSNPSAAAAPQTPGTGDSARTAG